MRNWKPPALPKTTDPHVYEAIKRISEFIVQAQTAFAKIDNGTSTDGSSSQLGVTDHGDLGGLTDDDHTQYLLLAGRSGGQSVLGDPGNSSTSTTPTLILANFNSALSTGAMRISLLGGGAGTGKIKVEAPEFSVFERTYTTGFSLFTGADFCNGQNTGSFSFFGAPGAATQVVLISNTGAAEIGDHSLVIRARSSQTGDMLRFENSATTRLSYVRASDGAFVGPVVPSTAGFTQGSIAFADSVGALAEDNANLFWDDTNNRLGIGTNAPAARLHLPAGAAAAGSAPLRLTSGTSLTTAVAGSVEFTTDNLFFTITTGTARKRLLMADSATGLVSGRVPFATTNGRLTDDSTFLFSAGTLTASNLTATGNVTGFLVAATSQLNVASFMSGQATGLRIGDTTAASYALDIALADATQAILVDLTNVTDASTGMGVAISFYDNNSGVQSGNRTALDVYMAALNVAAAGSSLGTVSGLNFNNVSSITNSITVAELVGSKVSTSILVSGSGAGTIAASYGARYLIDVQGLSVSGTDMIGLELQVGASAITLSRVAGIVVSAAGTYLGATTGVAYDITSNFAASANVTNWYGLRIPSITGPTNIWGIYQSGTMNSAIAGNLRIGSTVAPTVALDVTGSVKVSSLTSGRVVFAGTGGQLSDDADFTFATDTLTITKIAATQFTGDVQFTGSGTGWPYGSCYGNEIAWTQAVATTNTWYLISDTDMTDGELNNVTHDGSGKLTVTIAGRYMIDYSVSASVDAANTHMLAGIAVNGTVQNPGVQHTHNQAVNATTTISSSAILNLAANDTVEVALKHIAAGNQALSAEHLNITLVQVGG